MGVEVDDGRALVSSLGMAESGVRKVTLVFEVGEAPMVIVERVNLTSSADLGQLLVDRYQLVPQGEVTVDE